MQRRTGSITAQCLSIGIGTDELDTFNLFVDHILYGVATTATDTDNLNQRTLRNTFNQFKHVFLLTGRLPLPSGTTGNCINEFRS